MPTVTRAEKRSFDNTLQETLMPNSIKTESILNGSSVKLGVSEKQTLSNVNINKFNKAPKSDVESSNDSENEAASSDDSMLLCNLRLTKPEKLYQDLLAIGAGKYLQKSDEENRPGFTGKKTGYYEVRMGNCFLAACFRGHIRINAENGVAELDRVIHEEACLICTEKVKFTIRDCLSQDDYGVNGEGPAKCNSGGVNNCAGLRLDHGISYYLSGLCDGYFRLDEGKFHNHCMKCPGFGKCIGDYRQGHCEECGNHFWVGYIGKYHCPICPRPPTTEGESGSDDDGDVDRAQRRRERECKQQ
jgi:hypothetical protein